MISRLAAVVILLSVCFVDFAHAEDPAASATVHLYRESRIVARIYRAPIRINDEPLLNLANGVVWTAKLAPGTYEFAARDKDVFSDKDKEMSTLKVDLQPGQTVFIRASLVMGGRKPNTALTLVSEEEASKEMAGLKPVRAKDVLHPAYQE